MYCARIDCCGCEKGLDSSGSARRYGSCASIKTAELHFLRMAILSTTCFAGIVCGPAFEDVWRVHTLNSYVCIADFVSVPTRRLLAFFGITGHVSAAGRFTSLR